MKIFKGNKRSKGNRGNLNMLLILFLLVTEIYSVNAKEEETTELHEEEEKEEKEEKAEEENKEEALVQPPHIIFILADDMGWNDISFHNSPQIPTPNIDALASSTIILNNYYAEYICTPSRAALLSGRYPIHVGLQSGALYCGEPTGLPLDIKIMPEYFKSKGYATHMVGKWHLGYATKNYTPTYRGFDSFFGYFNAHLDYYDYTTYMKHQDKIYYGVDLQDGTNVVMDDYRGQYATDVFSRKALDIIENHNSSKPLFLYAAHLAVHRGNEYMPLQAPMDRLERNLHIKDLKRRLYAGVVAALDDAVGKLFNALDRKGFLQNSIIVFASDNGGEVKKNRGSNWPLRGQKFTFWEGGIRVPSFIWSPLLGLKEPKTSMQLMHVSDWLPTLYTAAGGDVRDLGAIDGHNMWNAFINNLPSPRIEILHNIDFRNEMAALRRGDYKLVIGKTPNGNYKWYPPTGLEDMEMPSSMDEWVFKPGSTVKEILEKLNLWLPKSSDAWRVNTTVFCNPPPPDDNGNCDPQKSPCLFNIAADPCEYKNLAHRYPRIVRSMVGMLNKYNATASPPLSTSPDPRADPRCHSFAFVPWMEEEFATDCSYS